MKMLQTSRPWKRASSARWWKRNSPLPNTTPLTLLARVAACNQKNNRDPVMQLSADEISAALNTRQYEKQCVGTFSSVGSRVMKYTHRPDFLISEEIALARFRR